ncbi:hypothetical protein R70006_03801 [Paraburkholderia domus]|uniref:hypothetical protein n=1 Tax=Paraburkholderia domus TaxID=2793075 RepID=UPI001914D0C8|nr:hypothetical protein [Paraburkholderia domus]MBK5047266.1 hypothetical protein [Burkholderia sp. R-70006]CAE6767790.1 hypothetical protein R70006_03801 [Paraburkholderia domus]
MKVRNLKRTRGPHLDSKIDRNEAAGLLFVSGSHFDALVRSGKVTPTSFGLTGPHLFSKADLLSYKKKQMKRQRKGLKMMMTASERMGLYDAEIDDLQTSKTGAPSD